MLSLIWSQIKTIPFYDVKIRLSISQVIEYFKTLLGTIVKSLIFGSTFTKVLYPNKCPF